MSARRLPAGPLIAFYGDDFTGSSASMEATAFAGVESVLFLSPPTTERLSDFAGYRVIGVAGVARAQSPEWMDEHLPPVFDLLAAIGAPVIHYKVCSTFDSAPHIGSIGRAADLAAGVFADEIVAVDAVKLVTDKSTGETREEAVRLEADECNRPGTTARSSTSATT